VRAQRLRELDHAAGLSDSCGPARGQAVGKYASCSLLTMGAGMRRPFLVATLVVLCGSALAIAINVGTGGTLPGVFARYQGLAWPAVAALILGSIGLAIWQQRYFTSEAPDRISVGGALVVVGGDLTIHEPRRPGKPGELLADIPEFTGRDDEVAQLLTLLKQSRDQEMTAVVISALSGQGGVGKTALAVHVAHLVRQDFPDGQLHVNLRGAEAAALGPAEVLGRFLRQLGIEDDKTIPEDLEERAALYRSRIADQRVLVLLDNAASEAQVRPLLPGSPTCAVIITSRVRLHGLEGARPLDLDVMARGSAVALLARVAGAGRIDAEPEAAEEIVSICGNLPLAIQIAGRKLAELPQQPSTRLAEQLRDTRERLSLFRAGDLDVRTSLSWSYQGLRQKPEQHLFRMLGLLRAPDFPAWIASALLDLMPQDGDRLVERLVDMRLLDGGKGEEDVAGQRRYRFHDLLRAFAQERLEEEEEERALSEALSRVIEGYLTLARTADAILAPSGRKGDMSQVSIPRISSVSIRKTPSRYDALTWFSAEKANLVLAVEQAFDYGLWKQAWQLALSLATFFETHAHWADWQRTHNVALAAARHGEDLEGEAQTLGSLGYLSREIGRPQEAADLLGRSLHIFRALSDHPGEARVLCYFIRTYRDLGRFAEALSCFQKALPLSRASDDQHLEANILRNMGMTYRDHGDLDEALSCLEDALSLFRQVGEDWLEAHTGRDIGMVYRQQGRLVEAETSFMRSLAVFEELDDRRAAARALNSLGECYRDQYRWADAVIPLRKCLEIFRDLGDRRWEAYTLRALGDTYREWGCAARQRRWPRKFIMEPLAQALTRLLGGSSGLIIGNDTGLWREAAVYLDESCQILDEIGDRQWKAHTLRSIGDLHREQKNWERGITHLEEALEIFRALGNRRLEAETLVGLGLTYFGNGDSTTARADWREALVIFQSLGITKDAAQVDVLLRVPPGGRADRVIRSR
jgi:tetratricopeptide (TPR) repeat protein